MVGPYPAPGLSPTGGVETSTVTLCRALARREDVTLSVIGTSADVDAIEVTNDDGYVVTHVPHRPGLLGWWRCFHQEVPRLIAAESPDVVHVQGVPSVAARQPQGLLTIHGTLYRDVWRNRRGRTRIPATAIALLIEGVPLLFARRRVVIRPDRRGHFIPNPLDTAFVTPSRRPTDAHLVACGALTPLKNTLGLLRAFREVFLARPDAKLNLIGTGPADYVRQCRDLIVELGLENAVIWHGALTPPQVADVMRQSRVLLHFSRQENSPMVVLEALASGCAVVATDVGGTRALLGGDPSSALVDSGDEGAFAAAAIQALRTDVDLTARMKLRTAYSPDRLAAVSAGVYRTIRDSGSAARIGDTLT